MKRQPKVNVQPADIEAAQQLHNALVQVEGLPTDSQWEMALELMPDSFLLEVVRSNRRKPDDMLNLLGLLSGVAIDALTGERAGPEVLTATLYGVIFSCLGELEKRYKQLSTNVVQMQYPFDYDPVSPVLFIPRDPENFTMEQVFDYYRANDPAHMVTSNEPGNQTSP